MTYDKDKAHEYYIKYRKKGLLKGRGSGKTEKTKGKKGSKKKTSLVGISTSGLNDAGRMQAALVKEKITSEMNDALSKAKTDAEKEQIRQEYQNKALTEIQKLKSDGQYAQAKKEKASKSTGGSSKSSGGSASKSSGSSKSGTSTKASSKTTDTGAKTTENATAKKLQESVDKLNSLMTGLSDKIAKMTDEQKAETKDILTNIISELKNQLGVDTTNIEKKLKEGLTISEKEKETV